MKIKPQDKKQRVPFFLYNLTFELVWIAWKKLVKTAKKYASIITGRKKKHAGAGSTEISLSLADISSKSSSSPGLEQPKNRCFIRLIYNVLMINETNDFLRFKVNYGREIF